MSLKLQKIVEFMRRGYTLTDTGCGWHLLHEDTGRPISISDETIHYLSLYRSIALYEDNKIMHATLRR